jgi:translation initiation factor 2 subunit 1
MIKKKKGLPETGEIVLCTVKKVLPHSVFVMLDEYGQEGMLHISEIAPGRIRNIRDYVKEEKKIICKILKVDEVKRHIDVSLRRVTLSQKRNKADECKQEQKADKLIEGITAKLKMTPEQFYKEACEPILGRFGTISDCFYAIVDNEVDLAKDLGINKKIADGIMAVVREKIKPSSVTISGIITLSSNADDGVERVKNVLKEMEHFKDYSAKITYIGAPRYSLSITAGDYKEAETRMSEIVEIGMKNAKKNNCEMNFERNKK